MLKVPACHSVIVNYVTIAPTQVFFRNFRAPFISLKKAQPHGDQLYQPFEQINELGSIVFFDSQVVTILKPYFAVMRMG